jgi:hypothetical protein
MRRALPLIMMVRLGRSSTGFETGAAGSPAGSYTTAGSATGYPSGDAGTSSDAGSYFVT